MGTRASKQLFAPLEVRELIVSNIESQSLVSETDKRLVKLYPAMLMSVTDNAPESGSNEQAEGAGVTRQDITSGDRARTVRHSAVRTATCVSSCHIKRRSEHCIRTTSASL